MAAEEYITLFATRYRRADVVAAIELLRGGSFSAIHTDERIIREINKLSCADLDEFRAMVDEVKE